MNDDAPDTHHVSNIACALEQRMLLYSDFTKASIIATWADDDIVYANAKLAASYGKTYMIWLNTHFGGYNGR